MPVLERMVGFLNTTNPDKAKHFFDDILGFTLLGEDDHAVVFDANGTMIRVNKAREFKPQHGTVLGWQVDEIYAAVRELVARGVTFEQFNLPFMKQDEHGVWTAPTGDRVAWFRDPDGNVLSISQHVGSSDR